MLLTITSRTPPARDLGHLLRKHPDHLQSFSLPFGTGHVFYPRANQDECTVALLVDVDPVGLVRGRSTGGESTGLVDAYVNDRPYAASSFLGVALARIFGAALGGRSKPEELAMRELTLEAVISPVRLPDRGWPDRLFRPLGYHVEATTIGEHYTKLRISATTTLARLLTHIYVLIPVMDGEKHYWVGEEEVAKLFRLGAEWLSNHPDRELITSRYLLRAPKLARAAVARLASLDDATIEPVADSRHDSREDELERPMRLQDRRIAAVVGAIRSAGAKTVADVGCGDGDLLTALARENYVERIVGTDVSVRELERAKAKLERASMLSSRRQAIELFQSSALYGDRRLQGLDAIALLEVIEHIDLGRLQSLEKAVFGVAAPRAVIITTPNREYNANFPTLKREAYRHPDHRFEWTRDEFATWCQEVAQQFRYGVSHAEVGDADAALGAPTQMAVFRCA
ncbi:MAG: 3' terminal RNA ribose 2'-O-methyltransferase Hen1 [Vulcanimicrobiaceae bacterium]